MKFLSNAEMLNVSGGDSWCNTPEGRSTASGGSPEQYGQTEVCQDAGFRVNGKEVEFCVITREAK